MGGNPYSSIDGTDVAMGREDFWFVARLPQKATPTPRLKRTAPVVQFWHGFLAPDIHAQLGTTWKSAIPN